MITCLIVNDTQVNVSKELASNVSHLFVPRVVVNGILVVVGIGLAQLHVVNTDAVVSKGLSVHVTYRLAHLQELLVGLNSLFELAQVVVEHTRRVVSTSLISGLASTTTGKSKDIVVFQALLGGDAIVAV